MSITSSEAKKLKFRTVLHFLSTGTAEEDDRIGGDI
jgi:hypothetical protein